MGSNDTVIGWASLKHKLISVLLSILLSAVIGFSVVSVAVSAVGWQKTKSYPTTIDGHSCVVSGGYVYCVGGDIHASASSTRAVYFAKLSSSGVGTWTKTTSYPTTIYRQSCVASGGYIYCVGGFNGFIWSGAVYFAKLSSSGVGTWKLTTYTNDVADQSCVASGGYIYCVGGYNGVVYTSAVYYAKLSSTGVGAWKSTTSYPTNVAFQSCVTVTGFIYCVGGYTGTSETSAVYTSTLSSAGVGSWSLVSGGFGNYPNPINSQSCVVIAGVPFVIYCVGGYNGNTGITSAVDVFAEGSWCVACVASYPTIIADQSCIVNGVDIYCIGGYNGSGDISAVYFFVV